MTIYSNLKLNKLLSDLGLKIEELENLILYIKIKILNGEDFLRLIIVI